MIGVSVEYRLAPETSYPGPLDDCYSALRWTYDNADELGIDKERIGIYGLSAGGGLAAVLALLARDRGEIPVAFVLLDCPMLDDRQRTPSIRAEGLYVWGSGSNAFGWRSYLGALSGSDDVPAYAAAARATDLAGLPPTCVVVGSIDGFRTRTSTTPSGSLSPVWTASFTSLRACPTPTCSCPALPPCSWPCTAWTIG